MIEARWMVLLWLVLGFSSSAWAQALSMQLRQMVSNADLGQATWGFCVMDLDSGQVVAEDHAEDPLLPASNMKLFTTAVALRVLGPDYEFTTELGRTRSESGPGDTLVVIADGDPAFGDPVLLERHALRVDDLLDQWVAAVKSTGQTRFSELIVDDRVFDQQFVHPGWETGDLVTMSGAEVAGLNFYRNCFDVIVTPTVAGQSPRISLFPQAPGVTIVNRATTGSRDDIIRDRRPGTNEMIFSGQIRNRQSAPYSITFHDPPLVFADVFRNRLHKVGITVDKVRRFQPQELAGDYQPLHRVTTTMQLVLERTNQDSQNMFAESLFKRVGCARTGESGSWSNGAAAMRQELHLMLGTAAAALTIADGSGLSRDNRVTAGLLVKLLYVMDRDPRLGPMYRQSLAEGGENGTLERRFQTFPGQVFGKSGYINGVCTLSGYMLVPPGDIQDDADEDTDADSELSPSDQPQPTPNDRRFAFSILFNDYRSPVSASALRRLQQRMLEVVAQAAQHGSI
ncbi:MAG: D-alanyl-D-alanine carboxypeptidase/D-alanyl-D-alanine-endopeptidase [Phycisphaeraceae bacterium]|nr:D-alanyl-D-alanine carboxypeptidase/D-alanyl-D-alanine-endopeptidase [Phycisphaeraceae bacterium]